MIDYSIIICVVPLHPKDHSDMEALPLLEQALQDYIDVTFGHLPRFEQVLGQFRSVRQECDHDVFMNVSDQEFIELTDSYNNPIVRPLAAHYKELLKLLEPFFPVLEDAKLSADFCCGEMVVLRFLHDIGLLGGEQIGFEPSLNRMKGCHNVPVLHCWPGKVPLEDGTVNLALCYDSLNFAKGWKEIAAEMARVTRTAGIVVAGFTYLGRSGLDAHTLASFLLEHGVEPLINKNHKESGGIRNLYAGVKVA